MLLFWFGFFGITAYLISALASITYVWGLHVSQLELIQLIATCILYMAGAWFTLKEASAIRYIRYEESKQKIFYKHRSVTRFCYIALYFICTLFSIFTTANMAFEAINRDSDYKTINSDSYKNAQASSELAQSSLKINNDMITSLLIEKENAVKKQLSQVDKWKATRVKERQREIDKANNISSSYDARIAKIRAENDKLQNKVSVSLPSSDVVVGSTKKSIMDMFPNVNFMMLALFAILLLSIGVDLLGAFFTIQYSKEKYFQSIKKGKNSPTPPTEKMKIPDLENDKKTDKLKKIDNLLDFASTKAQKNTKTTSVATANLAESDKKNSLASRSISKNEFSKKSVTDYINKMYELNEKGETIGYKKIAGRIGIGVTEAQYIRSFLLELDILRYENGETKIIVAKDKALLLTRKGA